MLARRGVPLVVMETHGGNGHVAAACYGEDGCVFDTDQVKSGVLARTRPTWQVWQGDCVRGLALGIGKVLPVTLLDVDPYGDPWPSLQAFFGSERAFQPYMQVCVNDGLMKLMRLAGAYGCGSLAEECVKYGSDGVRSHYHEVCRGKLARIVGGAGYRLDTWVIRSAGRNGTLTHYASGLVRVADRVKLWEPPHHHRGDAEHRRYLDSPGWKARSRRAILEAGESCQQCGATGTLQVHHLTYERVGQELPEDLLVLCISCHNAIHARMPAGSPGAARARGSAGRQR